MQSNNMDLNAFQYKILFIKYVFIEHQSKYRISLLYGSEVEKDID